MNLACRLYFWTVRGIICSLCHVFPSSKISNISWQKMSTSTQDKTNTSLPLPQERNSYTSTPYLVLTACMARKKWPQGWLTHPILLVKVCRLSYFEEIIKGWGKCLAINDFHKKKVPGARMDLPRK